MISASTLLNSMCAAHFTFYAGVPDSTLKSWCFELEARSAEQQVRAITTANEGNAIALCAGHYLATGQAGCVFMQNSGLGNAVNPLASLSAPEVYGIPMLLLIGWRGAPCIPDEPQHALQGKITLDLLETLSIPYEVLEPNDDEAVMQRKLTSVVTSLTQRSSPAALVVKPKALSADSVIPASQVTNTGTLDKFEVIARLTELAPSATRFFASTGHIARELYQVRHQSAEAHGSDFYCVGAMGHVSSIALGYALSHPQEHIVVLDGDGALLMHLGALYVIADQAQETCFHHIVFDNAAHDSVGGQPIASARVDYQQVALGLGYRETFIVRTMNQLESCFAQMLTTQGPSLMVKKKKKGAPADLMRPDLTPQQMKEAFMHA